VELTDLWLAASKAFGILATAGFGVVGMLTEFRDKATQRVTRWGRISLAGATVSAVLSMIIHGAEVLKARDEAKASAAKTQAELARSNQLLAQVGRTLERVDFEQIRLNVGLFVSLTEPGLGAYKRRLDAKTAELATVLTLSGTKLLEMPEQGLRLLQAGDDRQGRLFLTIYPGSPYWPRPSDPAEAMADQLLGRIGLTVQVSAPTHPDPRDAMLMVFAAHADGPKASDRERLKLTYDAARGRISLHARDIKSDIVDEPGRVFLSVPDFEGSEVTVDVVTAQGAAASMHSLTLGEFEIGFGRWTRSLWFIGPAGRVEGDGRSATFSAKLRHRLTENVSGAESAASGRQKQ
jgi:hypothetical protein